MNWFRWTTLFFAWMIAVAGVLLSVYYGEMSSTEPCHLCWYQRIALFPLAIFLGIGAYKSDRKIAMYALPLVLIGAFFALYQVFGEYLPSFCGDSDCSASRNLPILSAIGFGSMALLLFLSKGGKGL